MDIICYNDGRTDIRFSGLDSIIIERIGIDMRLPKDAVIAAIFERGMIELIGNIELGDKNNDLAGHNESNRRC